MEKQHIHLNTWITAQSRKSASYQTNLEGGAPPDLQPSLLIVKPGTQKCCLMAVKTHHHQKQGEKPKQTHNRVKKIRGAEQ